MKHDVILGEEMVLSERLIKSIQKEMMGLKLSHIVADSSLGVGYFAFQKRTILFLRPVKGKNDKKLQHQQNAGTKSTK